MSTSVVPNDELIKPIRELNATTAARLFLELKNLPLLQLAFLHMAELNATFNLTSIDSLSVAHIFAHAHEIVKHATIATVPVHVQFIESCFDEMRARFDPSFTTPPKGGAASTLSSGSQQATPSVTNSGGGQDQEPTGEAATVISINSIEISKIKASPRMLFCGGNIKPVLTIMDSIIYAEHCKNPYEEVFAIGEDVPVPKFLVEDECEGVIIHRLASVPHKYDRQKRRLFIFYDDERSHMNALDSGVVNKLWDYRFGSGCEETIIVIAKVATQIAHNIRVNGFDKMFLFDRQSTMHVGLGRFAPFFSAPKTDGCFLIHDRESYTVQYAQYH